MRRAAMLVGAALILCAPSFAHAQYSDLDKQNPNQYTDDDSQPLKLLSYVLAPIGFVLEWGVARPLHYLATDTFLAPVLGANTDNEKLSLPPIAELPPPDQITDSSGTAHHDFVVVPLQPLPPVTPVGPQSSAAATISSGQPALH
jgi:hypothetical protein